MRILPVLLCLISLFGQSALAGETWVLIGRDFAPALRNPPKGSLADKSGIAGFAWWVDLQSIVSNGSNIIVYNEKGGLIDKTGNGVRDSMTETGLRIVDCKTGLIKWKEFSDWTKPLPGQADVVDFLCSGSWKISKKKSFV